MILRDAQVAALRTDLERQFIERVRQFTASHLRTDVATEDVAALLLRGRQLGLASERELARYIFIGAAAGAGAAAPDPDWMAAIMNRTDLLASHRLERLFAEAAGRLQPAAALSRP